MSISAAANQKAIDDSSDVELMMEQIEQEMREELLAGDYYALEFRNGFGIATAVYDKDNVVEAMIEVDGEVFNQAVMMMSSEPLEAAKILHVLKLRAIGQVIGTAEIREDAEYRIELAGRKAA